MQPSTWVGTSFSSAAGSHDHRVLLLVLQTVHAVKAANPRILNLQKLSNRIKRDLLFVTRQQQLLQEQPGSSEQQDGLEQWGGLTESRLQVKGGFLLCEACFGR